MSNTDDFTPSGALEELHSLWVNATEDTISSDLARATALAERMPPESKEEVDRYLQALWRLERWLHDR